MDYCVKLLSLLIYLFLVILHRVPLSSANHPDLVTSASDVVVAKRQAGALCVPLTALNGQVNYLQTNPRVPFSFGTTAILTCNFGYTMSGSSNSICTNTIWTPPLGTCNQLATTLTMLSGGQRGCLALLSPPNGQLAYSEGGPIGPFPLGTTVTLECRPGFLPIGGAITSTCENGLWEPMALGLCNPTGTGMPLSIGMQPMPGTTGAGFSMGPLGGPGGGASGGVLGCPPLLSALGGVVEYSTLSNNAGMYTSGTVATLVCNNPGSVSTQPSSTCLNGIWSPPLLICQQSGGGSASAGLLPSSPSTLGGGVFRPTMMPGGGLLPPNGGAFPTLPSGFRGAGLTHCLLPIAPPLGGQVSYSQGGLTGPFPVGAVATLTCMSGTPTGQTASRCDGGQWMPPFFQPCSFSDSVNGNNNNFNRFNNFMSVSPPTIGGDSFGMPSSPSSGGNGEERPAGGGSTPSEAAGSGQSLMLTGRCTFGMPDVMGGTINYSQGGPFGPYPPGTIASLHCHNGGVSTSYMSSSCLNGGWTPPVLGPCGPSTTGIPEGGSGGGGSEVGGEGAGNNRISGSTPTLVFGSNTLFPTTISFGSGAENGGDVEGGALATRSSGSGDTPPPPFPTPNSILLSGLSTMTHLLAQCLLGPLAPLNGHVTFAPPPGASNNGGAVSGGGILTMGPHVRGTTATLTCNSGFAPTGPTMATCEGGMFQPNFGQCMAMVSAGAGGMAGEQMGTTRPFLARTPNNSAVADKVDEKRVIAEVEGVVTAMKGETTTAAAMSVIDDPRSMQLAENRVTAATAATTIPTSDGCPEIVLPNGGGRIRYEPATLAGVDATAVAVAHSQHALGTKAQLECEEGFTNEGSSTTTCERIGWTAPVLGDCVPRESSSAATSPNAASSTTPQEHHSSDIALSLITTMNGSSNSGEESSTNSNTSAASLLTSLSQ